MIQGKTGIFFMLLIGIESEKLSAVVSVALNDLFVSHSAPVACR